jgi:hypothetical protein
MNAQTTRRPLLVLTAAALLTGALAACGSTPHVRSGFIPQSVVLTEDGELTSAWGGKLDPATIGSVKVVPKSKVSGQVFFDLERQTITLSVLLGLVNL